MPPPPSFLQLGTVDLLFPVDVTPRNGFELVHGFSYEFRNIQCLHYSATPISCSPIHHQISLIFSHPNNTTSPHSFPLSTIICYFPYSFPEAHGIQAHHSLETYKTHGQYSQNNSIDDRSYSFHYNNLTLIPLANKLSAISYTLPQEHMDYRHNFPGDMQDLWSIFSK